MVMNHEILVAFLGIFLNIIWPNGIIFHQFGPEIAGGIPET